MSVAEEGLRAVEHSFHEMLGLRADIESWKDDHDPKRCVAAIWKNFSPKISNRSSNFSRISRGLLGDLIRDAGL